MSLKMSIDSSQTVGRAVRILFELAGAPRGLTVTELAKLVDTQRAPLYRVLETLSAYRLIRRNQNKLYFLSVGVLELARTVSEPLETLVRPALQDLANSTNTTAMLILAEGDVLTAALAVTPESHEDMHITATAGFRLPDGPIPSRLVMDAALPGTPDDSAEVVAVRQRGYAVSHGMSATGRFGIAAPVTLGTSHPRACILLITLREATEEEFVPAITSAAAQISALFANHRR
jgi:DNA-binding IclR family transcriptional regulator